MNYNLAPIPPGNQILGLDMSDSIRIVIASEYCLTRCGLRQLFKQEHDFKVIAETGIPGELAEIQSQHSPDAVLLIPAVDQAYCPTTLVKESPELRIVLIASNENLGYVRAMLAVGVLGYVLRKSSDAELFLAVRSVARGHRFIDPRLSDSVADILLGKPMRGEHSTAQHLSKRESQVLQAIARGFTAREAAVHLGVSVKTVETYRSRVYEKLHLTSRADLFEYALAAGLLTEELAPR